MFYLVLFPLSVSEPVGRLDFLRSTVRCAGYIENHIFMVVSLARYCIGTH